MQRFSLLLIAFIFHTAIYSQSILKHDSVQFIQSNLYKSKLPFRKLEYLNEHSQWVFNDTNRTNLLIESQFNETYKIVVGNYYSSEEDSNFETPDSITSDFIMVYGIKYRFDSILSQSGFSNYFQPVGLDVEECYELNYNSNKYVIISLDWSNRSSSGPPFQYIFILDFTSPIKIKLFGFETLGTITECINDFNLDNKLDFWSMPYICSNSKDSANLKVYTLDKGNIIPDKENYLTVYESMIRYYIDLNKSNWFFNLNKK